MPQHNNPTAVILRWSLGRLRDLLRSPELLDWPMHRQNPACTGFNELEKELTTTLLGKVWSVDLDGGIAASPAVADGVVYVSAGDLHALRDWTGVPLWNRKGFFETPAVLNGTVYYRRTR